MSKTTQTETQTENISDSNSDIFTYELKRPVTIGGTEYKKITLNLNGLTGDDIASSEIEMTATGHIIAGPAELNKTYLMHISARAAGIPYDVLKQLSIKDISAITNITQNFLMQ
ncbi:phage tail assembly protein [Gilliamella apicola]|uniref:phage tail assembly protein n=1 Tax=Gilliamella apicola TaxID=1196095 RepID=UPI0039880632